MNGKALSSKAISILLLAAALAGCTDNPLETAAPTAAVSTETTAKEPKAAPAPSIPASSSVTYDNYDLSTDWQSKNPNYIELKDSSASLKGTGAALSGNQIMIMQSGVYVISGKMDNGQIIVDTENKGTVQLVLNGMELTRSDSSAIYVKKADKTVITLAEGSRNTVSDGKNYKKMDAEDEPNAAIYSKDDLTVNGAGSLTIAGNFKDGLTSRDDLKIAGGNIIIRSVDDGILGRDLVAVKEGTLSIEAGGDGIKATNDADGSKGNIALEGGTFTIKSGNDGIQAETSVLIAGGSYTLTAGGGSAKVTKKTGNTASDQESFKGIKAGSDLTIAGGTFKLDTADDGLHSNNSLTVAGGEILIDSGSKGVHADASLTIDGGKTTVTKSYEGLESKLITVNGGETRVISTDDGVNVTAGNEGGPGSKSGSRNEFHVKGGYIAVNSTSDGLDANGSIYISGGTVVVSGPTVGNMGTGALDYDGVLEMTGGTLVSASSLGRAHAPSANTKQYAISMSFPKVQEAGTIVSLKDSNDETIATFAPVKPFQSMVISSPKLKKDASYTLYTGGTSTGNANDGFYDGGTSQAGTKLVSFTIKDMITWLNESGVTTSGSSRGASRPRGQ
jgi:hypothetical protein